MVATFGALGISLQEKNERVVAVREALAITRLEGGEPGQNVMAVYDRYIRGDIDWDVCEQEVKTGALQDAREEGYRLEHKYPD